MIVVIIKGVTESRLRQARTRIGYIEQIIWSIKQYKVVRIDS